MTVCETWPCAVCGHKHYPSQDCPAHRWTDFCPYEGLDCPTDLAEKLVLQAAESVVRYGANPTLDDLLPPADD